MIINAKYIPQRTKLNKNNKNKIKKQINKEEKERNNISYLINAKMQNTKYPPPSPHPLGSLLRLSCFFFFKKVTYFQYFTIFSCPA